MTKRTTKNPARRIQVEQQLAQAIALEAVPALSEQFPLTSVTRVELTRDLKEGTVFVTAAPSVDHAEVVATLTRRLPAVRRELRRQLSLKYFPNLTVRYDEGQADALKIAALLEGQR